MRSSLKSLCPYNNHHTSILPSNVPFSLVSCRHCSHFSMPEVTRNAQELNGYITDQPKPKQVEYTSTNAQPVSVHEEKRKKKEERTHSNSTWKKISSITIPGILVAKCARTYVLVELFEMEGIKRDLCHPSVQAMTAVFSRRTSHLRR